MLKRNFQSQENLENLRAAGELRFRDWMKILPPASGPDSADGLPLAVGLVLSRAVIHRLRSDHLKDAEKREDSVLVRYYPGPTAAILNQALHRLDDIVQLDLCRFPEDPLERRVERLLGALMVLPQGKRRSELSVLRYLVSYEDAYRRLFPNRGNRYRSEDLERVFGRLPTAQVEKLAGMTRGRLALEFVSRKVQPQLTPDRIKSLLRGARRLAREVDRALLASKKT